MSCWEFHLVFLPLNYNIRRIVSHWHLRPYAPKNESKWIFMYSNENHSHSRHCMYELQNFKFIDVSCHGHFYFLFMLNYYLLILPQSIWHQPLMKYLPFPAGFYWIYSVPKLHAINVRPFCSFWVFVSTQKFGSQ